MEQGLAIHIYLKKSDGSRFQDWTVISLKESISQKGKGGGIVHGKREETSIESACPGSV